jgi:hypothetical protein
VLTVAGVTILVGVEVFGTALAAGWAIAGLFELGQTVSYGLMGIFSAIGAWGMWKFVLQAARVEGVGG